MALAAVVQSGGFLFSVLLDNSWDDSLSVTVFYEEGCATKAIRIVSLVSKVPVVRPGVANMSRHNAGRRRSLLVLAALVLATASTLAIGAYYRAYIGVASGVAPRLVWFSATLALAFIVGVIVLSIAERFGLSTSAGINLAFAAMTLAVLAMIGVEWASTWQYRAMPRVF